MENLSVVTLICGLPGSGKTHLVNAIRQHHLCRSLDKELEDDKELTFPTFGGNLYFISYDELIPVVGQMKMISTPGMWKKIRRDVICATDAFICRVLGLPFSSQLSDTATMYLEKLIHSNKQEINSSKNAFLVDDNFYYQSMRHEWYLLAKKLSMGFCQIYLECPPEVALTRNCARKSTIPNDVIYLMAKKIEAPNQNKNPWEKNSLSINVENQQESYVYLETVMTSLGVEPEEDWLTVSLANAQQLADVMEWLVDSLPCNQEEGFNWLGLEQEDRLLSNDKFFEAMESSLGDEGLQEMVDAAVQPYLETVMTSLSVEPEKDWLTVSPANAQNKVLIMIEESLKNPLRPEIEDDVKENDKKICSTNIIHQIDIILRRLTGEKIKELQALHSDKATKKYSMHLNSARRDILKGLKQGELTLSKDVQDSIECGNTDDSELQNTIAALFKASINVKNIVS